MSSIMKKSEDSIKKEVPENTTKNIDLDYVLINEVGQFGRYQQFSTLLAFIPLMLSASLSEYVFGAAHVPHRCRISECGEVGNLVGPFEPTWISHAIPTRTFTATGLSSCHRFRSLSNGTLDYCPVNLFDQNVEIECDSFVYVANISSVVYDFDLGCQEWKRTLAGAFSNLGAFLMLPITGYISDHFGRRMSLIFNVLNMGIFGIIRAFSVNYPMYIMLQFLQTALGDGTFSSGYIFATELAGPKWRVLISATSTSMFAFGSVIFGATAWSLNSWRLLLIVFNVPCFLIVGYYWVLCESTRWLMSKRRFEEAREVLKKVARLNGTRISEKSIQALMDPRPPPANTSTAERNSMIRTILNSRVLFTRVLVTPFWWVTSTFVYYGLTINPTALSDQIHLNFILTSAVEIPGNYSAILLLDRIGRKPTMCGGFVITAVCNIAFAFMPYEMTYLRLGLFLLSKLSISMVFTSLYQYTLELYPTEYRHSLFAFSSVVGRLGSVAATFMPLLGEFWIGLPTTLFGALCLLSTALVCTQPETRGAKMPDTLAEAEALGTPDSKPSNAT